MRSCRGVHIKYKFEDEREENIVRSIVIKLLYKLERIRGTYNIITVTLYYINICINIQNNLYLGYKNTVKASRRGIIIFLYRYKYTIFVRTFLERKIRT